jgi:hypothetical protein
MDFEHHFLHKTPKIELNISEGWVKRWFLVTDTDHGLHLQ